MTTYSGWHFLSDPTQLSNDGGPLLPVVELPKGIHPELCSTGFHASRRPLDALSFAPGPWLCRVRLEGEVVRDDDKAVGSRRVLLAGPVDVSRELRLFACDCAERVLPLFERERPDDARPRMAIEIARRYANGKAVSEETAAAGDAARAAAGDAAWAAAWAAAGDAARDAAWAAARAAARAAAWDAAGDAAWAAARAAAGAAAGDAARDAAGAAARDWQNRRLAKMFRAATAAKENA